MAKAFAILEAVGRNGRDIGLTEISSQIGLHKSTAFRLLTTLELYGYVSKDCETSRYKLGLKILELAGQLLEEIDIRKIARPVLEKLVSECNETAHLVILEKNRIVYIDKVESSNPIRLHSRIGFFGNAHSTSAGKAMLAFMPKTLLTQIIKETGLPKKTNRTITNEKILLEHLKEIKQRGYAIDDLENEEGVRCVAAPIRNHLGETIAAISVAGPSNRLTIQLIETQLKHNVIEAANEVASLLGYIKK